MIQIPNEFRMIQRQCGIWKDDMDNFLGDLTAREGQEDAYSALASLLEHDKRIVVLTGESRSGKTCLLSAYVNEIARRRWGTEEQTKMPRFMTFFEMELALRAAQTKGTMDELFKRLVDVPELAIDEIGRGKWSDFTSTFFTNLLIRRYGERRETVMATNLKVSELVDMLDLAMIERLKESGAIISIRK